MIEMAVKTILLNRSVFENNDERAALLREKLKRRDVFYVNVMSSPGAGKTTLLTALINALKEKYRIAVIEADIDSDVDARKVAETTGCESVQAHTGGMCHIDADMSAEALDALGDGFDLVFLENVGNLVCPAEYDTGASMDMTILSVPEGDDKPLKYPLVFQKSELVLIGKTDALPYFDFDIGRCRRNILNRNPRATIIPISAKEGNGIDAVAEYFTNRITQYKG